MKLLFLGGTGNISTACVEQARERGHDVTIVTRGRTASRLEAGARAVAGDRDDAAFLGGLARASRFDAVIDFLGYRPEQVTMAIDAFGGRIGQYVFISTTAAYEKPVARYVITEETPLANPFWEYARLKIECEERLRAARERSGFPATVVRPSYTYGPTWIPSGFGGQDYTVVGRMRRGEPIVCHGDGTSLWVMTAASDFAAGLVGLLGQEAALGEAFHITSDEVLTWQAIYRTIALAAGAELEMVQAPSALIAAMYPERGGSLLGDKAWSVVFDNAKIRRFVPDYRPRVTFAAGMARSIAWYDAEAARRVIHAESNRRIDEVIAAQRRAQPA
ncbi:MAG TPA: NAD-dependent epimerase/dehydratase family protein [Vicinamibacteria bacterium]|nr:NAD-dependent epimerase/dehydratase family protein [Vicinamibacteria bacterium]